MKYIVYLSQRFLKTRHKALKKDKNLKDSLRNTLENLIIDPYSISERLPFQRGKRRIIIPDSEWKVIFSICEECLQSKDLYFNCPVCKRQSERDIIIFDLLQIKRS